MNRFPWSGAASLVFCIGCGAHSGADIGEQSHPVVAGTPSEDLSVVAILDAKTGDLCTGTLIHPRVVLTAKHCVQDAGAVAPLPPERLWIVSGDKLGQIASDRLFYAQAIGAHEGTWQANGSDLPGNDVAVIVLKQAADLPVREIRPDAPADQVGQNVKVVGFGLTPTGGNGVKLEATTLLQSIDGEVLVTGPSICKGDSGGPMIQADGRVIGVASIGTKVCGSGPRGFNTLPKFKLLIDAAIEMACPSPDTDGCAPKTLPCGGNECGAAGASATPSPMPKEPVALGRGDGGCALVPKGDRPAHLMALLWALVLVLSRLRRVE